MELPIRGQSVWLPGSEQGRTRARPLLSSSRIRTKLAPDSPCRRKVEFILPQRHRQAGWKEVMSNESKHPPTVPEPMKMTRRGPRLGPPEFPALGIFIGVIH